MGLLFKEKGIISMEDGIEYLSERQYTILHAAAGRFEILPLTQKGHNGAGGSRQPGAAQAATAQQHPVAQGIVPTVGDILNAAGQYIS